MPLRLIFMGTPDFSVPTLRALYEAGHELVVAYTREPKPGGRGMKLQPTPVEREARQLGIPVLTPKTLRTPQAREEFRAHKAHAAVVVAYGLILPKPILDAPEFGCYNLHASILPRWRGAAPINRAIMEGDKESGVKFMKMDEGLDTGDAAIGIRTPITDGTTAGDLHDVLAQLGAALMVRKIDALERRKLRLFPQTRRRLRYAKKIDNSETRIDWTKPAHVVLRHIHGLSRFPGAWSEISSEGEAARLKIFRCEISTGKGAPGTILDDHLTIACGEGAIRIVELQRAGKAPMKAAEFLRGTAVKPGTRLQ